MADLRKAALPPFLCAALFLTVVTTACSRIPALTPETLHAAQEKWAASGPAYYEMLVEMKGDRLEASQYEVTVRSKEVVKLRRNNEIVLPGGGGQDYSVEGLFHILDQEIGLAEKPGVLGAPPGYASYPMAEFDSETGRLLRFQRSVGGTKNSIEIRVNGFKVLGK